MAATAKHKTSRADPPPNAIVSEIAGEGVTNFIESQQVLFDLAKEQTKILMRGVKERIGNHPTADALADTLQRGVDACINMQKEFLKIAGKQTHAWVEASKTGKPYKGEHLAELAREGMETVVKAQKQFLDVILEETEKATSGKRPQVKKIKKTELSALARQSANSFVEARKKLFDVAGRQMNASVKAAGKTLELVKPFPFVRLAELTKNGVKGFVDAPKALMDKMLKESPAQKRRVAPVYRAKRASHPSKKASVAAAA